jgi:hypothetical protein
VRQRYRSNTHLVGLIVSVLLALVAVGGLTLAGDNNGFGAASAYAWHGDGIDWDSCPDPDPADKTILKSVLNCRARAAAWDACHDKGSIHVSGRGAFWIDGSWIHCADDTVTVEPDSCARSESFPSAGSCRVSYIVYDTTNPSKMARCEGRVVSRLDFGKPMQVFSRLQGLSCHKFDSSVG